MATQPVSKLPEGNDWIFEIKLVLLVHSYYARDRRL